MDKIAAAVAIEKRAFDARLPLYKLCERAKVAPSTISRWRAGATPSLTTIGKLEDALSEIEAERAKP